MKTKTITAGNNSITLKTMSAGKYYDLTEDYQKTGSDARYAQKVIFHSIKEWDFKDANGAVLPVTLENFNEIVGTDCLDALSKAAEEVNGLTPGEKKTS